MLSVPINDWQADASCSYPPHFRHKTAYVLHLNTFFAAKVKIFKRFLVKSKKCNTFVMLYDRNSEFITNKAEVLTEINFNIEHI